MLWKDDTDTGEGRKTEGPLAGGDDSTGVGATLSSLTAAGSVSWGFVVGFLSSSCVGFGISAVGPDVISIISSLLLIITN